MVLRMTVRPLAALTVNTGYVLAVSQEIADLSGDRLPQSTVVDFNTVESFPAGELAFVRGVEIIKSATDGSNPVTLVQNGSRPSWSPDGSRLAFTRPADNSLESWQLCIARSDGSDLRCATGATGP
jgi:hypothetical protein